MRDLSKEARVSAALRTLQKFKAPAGAFKPNFHARPRIQGEVGSFAVGSVQPPLQIPRSPAPTGSLTRNAVKQVPPVPAGARAAEMRVVDRYRALEAPKRIGGRVYDEPEITWSASRAAQPAPDVTRTLARPDPNVTRTLPRAVPSQTMTRQVAGAQPWWQTVGGAGMAVPAMGLGKESMLKIAKNPVSLAGSVVKSLTGVRKVPGDLTRAFGAPSARASAGAGDLTRAFGAPAPRGPVGTRTLTLPPSGTASAPRAAGPVPSSSQVDIPKGTRPGTRPGTNAGSAPKDRGTYDAPQTASRAHLLEEPEITWGRSAGPSATGVRPMTSAGPAVTGVQPMTGVGPTPGTVAGAANPGWGTRVGQFLEGAGMGDARGMGELVGRGIQNLQPGAGWGENLLHFAQGLGKAPVAPVAAPVAAAMPWWQKAGLVGGTAMLTGGAVASGYGAGASRPHPYPYGP